MDRPKVGVAVVIVKNNKVLLGLRRGSHGINTWCVPGGHLEYGELLEQCAARELLEETGLTARNYEFSTITNDLFTSEQKHYITIFMYCEYISGQPELKEPDRCMQWKWFDWDALPSPLFLPEINVLKQGYTPHRQSANARVTHGIYLSGSVPKSLAEREKYVDWRVAFLQEAKKQKLTITGISPNEFTYDMMPTQYFYGRDVELIYLADVVLVDAREKMGIGTAQELLIAHYYKKPVIAIAPLPSHYNKYIDTPKRKHVHYVHPFLESSASIVVADYTQAVKVLKAHYSGRKSLVIKTIDNIEKARQEFVREALKFDAYTKKLLDKPIAGK